MKRKIIVLLFLVSLCLLGCDKIKDNIKNVVDNPKIKESIPLMEFGEYKDFIIDDVMSLSIIKYTVAGRNEEKISDKEIQEIYNKLSKIKVSNTTGSSCEDNTTIYRFMMKDGTSVSFEFECDWLVVNNERYEIEK